MAYLNRQSTKSLKMLLVWCVTTPTTSTRTMVMMRRWKKMTVAGATIATLARSKTFKTTTTQVGK